MSFNNPTQYETNNTPHRIDAKLTLENFGYLINIKENDCILDIGCGDGFVTNNILGEYLGKNINELVGIDISEKMIKHAENKYLNDGNRDGKLIFKVLDVMTNDVPKELQNRFDHAFSFHCFHWVRDFSLGLNNVKRMLKSQGDILFTFLTDHPFFKTLKNLSANAKYSPYLPNFDNILPDYFRCNNMKEWCKNVFEENGFEIKFLEIVETEYIYSSIHEYKNLMNTVNPFKIPEDLIDNYLEDMMDDIRKIWTTIEDDDGSIREHYKVFIVSATVGQ